MLKRELIELYKQTDRKYNRELFMKLYEVKVNFTDLEFAVKNYKQILGFASYVIFNKGTNRVRVGENIFDFLQWLIIYICESCDFDIEILDESLIDNSTDDELKKIHTINLNLFYFAKELFNYSIPRGLNDSRWKGYALGIIAKLLNYYKISNKFELFIIGLQRTKEKVILEALNELHYHFENFQEEQLSEEIVRELDKLILKTKNRTIATGALNLQVITKFISEIEALSRIDDWKEKFYRT